MTDVKATLELAYAAFNRRDVDAALALMTEDVTWPKASEGGTVVGKEAIRAYWRRQWGEFDPQVEPLAVTKRADGKWTVEVRQQVRNLEGEVLADDTVVHVFTVRGELIAAMDLGEAEHSDAASGAAPSAAFSRR